ncbi:signal transduction histidine kinase [Okibacterium sp. HSC-33S16]|uniref:sensor histidine kinase n=1 Tax=Okibacterium sp. HSC-33S16 TaxID=2910965 RepID=UPI0020A13C0B|nr:histidine kinase [Okibacterium sp. HSC-33S16]MCP2030995.1 signal transduction histidine kinase [Okibacterium sp. HSC-33S16]
MQNDNPNRDRPVAGGTAVLPAPRRWRLDERLSRVGLGSPLAQDTALAVIVALLGAVMVWVLVSLLGPSEGLSLTAGDVTALLVTSTVQSLFLCFRRSRPVLCLVLVAVAQVVLVALLPVGFGFRGFAAFVAAYTVGALLPFRPALQAVVAVVLLEVVAGVAVSLLVSSPPPGSGTVSDAIGGVGILPLLLINFVITAVLSYVAAALVGSYVATRRTYVELVHVRATEAIREQEARADAAIRAERSRMARELHDIAAHHLSGMVVQAGAVERLIDRDPQAAKDATAWIRAQGRETLANLRSVVGVLREPTATGSIESAPVPGVDGVDELIETARSLGSGVELTREGDPFPLAPIADVTLYRVLQEALSNARQHAPGQPVRVRLAWGAASVTLEVENSPAANAQSNNPQANNPSTDARSGLGLVGMRERAHILGARLDAGPSPHGWRVELEVPAERADSAGRAERAEKESS